MNTSTISNYSGNYSTSAPAKKTVQRQSSLSFTGWIAMMSSALSMANAVPDNGRVSASQMAKVRSIAKSI